MFKTHESCKIHLLSDDNEQGWDYVSLFAQHYWLYVTYEILDEDDELRANQPTETETVIFWRVKHLIELSKTNNVRIKFVDLGSPSYMNGSTRWKMEPLRDIWLSANKDQPNKPNRFFELENGFRYKDLMPDVLDEEIKEDQIIFSMAAI